MNSSNRADDFYAVGHDTDDGSQWMPLRIRSSLSQHRDFRSTEPTRDLYKNDMVSGIGLLLGLVPFRIHLIVPPTSTLSNVLGIRDSVLSSLARVYQLISQWVYVESFLVWTCELCCHSGQSHFYRNGSDQFGPILQCHIASRRGNYYLQVFEDIVLLPTAPTISGPVVEPENSLSGQK